MQTKKWGNGVSEFSPRLEMYNSRKEKRARGRKESNGIFSVQNLAESYQRLSKKVVDGGGEEKQEAVKLKIVED